MENFTTAIRSIASDQNEFCRERLLKVLSDRLGRRFIMLASLEAFIILTALTATASSAGQLMFWRLLALAASCLWHWRRWDLCSRTSSAADHWVGYSGRWRPERPLAQLVSR